VIVYHDINKLINDYKDKHIYIIGGKQIYEAFYKYADELIISIIKRNYPCDTFLDFKYDSFNLVKEEKHDEFSVEYYSKEVE
jgi:dihydrofolate reductase